MADLAVTTITLGEQVQGRLAVIRQARAQPDAARGYLRLRETVEFYQTIPLVDFTNAAIDHFEELRRQGVRIGTQDLRIAAIALVVCHDNCDERGGRGRGRAKPSPQKTIHHNLVDKPLGCICKPGLLGRPARRPPGWVKYLLRRDCVPPNLPLCGYALAQGAILVNRNTRDFAQVPKLTLEEWAS